MELQSYYALQEKLRHQTIRTNNLPFPNRYIAGADVAYSFDEKFPNDVRKFCVCIKTYTQRKRYLDDSSYHKLQKEPVFLMAILITK